MPALRQSKLNIYPLENYEFQKKNDHVKNDPSIPTSFLRLKREFYLFGMRRSVQAVLLCHHHNTIHVLLLEESSANFILPGGDLGPDESEEDGLKRYLFTFFGISTDNELNVIDIIANWWRPNFSLEQYPYIPAHVTKPKELTRIFLLALQEKEKFILPDNYNVVALPIFDLYSNKMFNEILSNLPQVLSRFTFNFV